MTSEPKESLLEDGVRGTHTGQKDTLVHWHLALA